MAEDEDPYVSIAIRQTTKGRIEAWGRKETWDQLLNRLADEAGVED